MKQKYLSLLAALLILCTCPKAMSQNFLDTNTYNVLDEDTFAVLMYDYTNSIILGFLGESNAPDMRREIEEMRQKDRGAVAKAETLAALLNCRMDLLQTKAEVIDNIKKAGINVILRKNLNPDALVEVMKPWEKRFDRIWEKAQKAQSIPAEDSFISFAILQPNLDITPFINDAPLPIIRAAMGIAVSRFDNQKLFKNIKNCIWKS